MPRQRRPWFRKERGMFYVQVAGKQHPLGVSDPEDAERAYQKLLARLAADLPNAAPTPPQQPASAEPITVSAAVQTFLARMDRRVAAGKIDVRSVRNYRISLEAFQTAFGTRSLTSLTSIEIEEWAARPDWSASYQNTTLGTVCSLLRFHKVALDPPIQRPAKESRGAEACLTDEQFEKVLAHVYTKRGKPGDLIPLLKLLRECGARPAEAAHLTVESINWEQRCTLLTNHKSKRKTGRDRPLPFNSAAMDVLREQRAKYGSGLLFRTRGGGKAYAPNVIVKQLLKVSKRVGFRVTAYFMRHTFATSALVAGVSDTMVAALLGHRGTGMLAKHYSHVTSDARAMAAAAEKASTKRPPS